MPENTGIVAQSDSASNSQIQETDRLKSRCERAIEAGNGEVAEAYHARLIDAEFAARAGGE